MKNENENLKKADELLDEGCNKFNKEDFQGAIDKFSKAIELNSNNAEYYISRGHALLEWAGEDFHKALKIDPDNEEAIFFADLIDDMHGDV